MEILFFVFSVDAFQFSNFLENEARYEKRKFKRSLIVRGLIRKMLEKIGKLKIKILKAYFFMVK